MQVCLIMGEAYLQQKYLLIDEFLRSRLVPRTIETEEGKGEEDGDGDGGGHGHGIRPQPCTFIHVNKMGPHGLCLVTSDNGPYLHMQVA